MMQTAQGRNWDLLSDYISKSFKSHVSAAELQENNITRNVKHMASLLPSTPQLKIIISCLSLFLNDFNW